MKFFNYNSVIITFCIHFIGYSYKHLSIVPIISTKNSFISNINKLNSDIKVYSNDGNFIYLDLYCNVTGFINNDEYNKISFDESEGIYGELLPESVRNLLVNVSIIKFNDKDIMYDLGSGIGKLVTQIAYETNVTKCIGIELGRKRHEIALDIYKKLLYYNDININAIAKNKLKFLNNDVLNIPWEDDATILFINAFFFSNEVMDNIEMKIKKSTKLRYIFLFGQYLKLLEDPNWLFNYYRLPVSMTFSDEVKCELYISQEVLKELD